MAERPGLRCRLSPPIDALLESYIFYEVNRFDIKGKDYLRTLGKYYIVDPGLRHYLLGNRGGDGDTFWKTSFILNCCGVVMRWPSARLVKRRSTSSQQR